MFTGDNVLGHGNSVVVEDLFSYMESLQTMKQSVQVEDLKIGYPGHGAAIEDLPAKVAIYSRHWEAREKLVLSAFVGTKTKNRASWTTRDVTVHLYGAAMDAMAGPFIGQVLSKLAEEGEVGFTLVGKEKHWFRL